MTFRLPLALATLLALPLPARAEEPPRSEPTASTSEPRGIGLGAATGYPGLLFLSLPIAPLRWLELEPRLGAAWLPEVEGPTLLAGLALTGRVPLVEDVDGLFTATVSYARGFTLFPLESDPPREPPEHGLLVAPRLGVGATFDDLELRVGVGFGYLHWEPPPPGAQSYPQEHWFPTFDIGVVWWPWTDEEAP